MSETYSVQKIIGIIKKAGLPYSSRDGWASGFSASTSGWETNPEISVRYSAGRNETLANKIAKCARFAEVLVEAGIRFVAQLSETNVTFRIGNQSYPTQSESFSENITGEELCDFFRDAIILDTQRKQEEEKERQAERQAHEDKHQRKLDIAQQWNPDIVWKSIHSHTSDKGAHAIVDTFLVRHVMDEDENIVAESFPVRMIVNPNTRLDAGEDIYDIMAYYTEVAWNGQIRMGNMRTEAPSVHRACLELVAYWVKE